ncbi:MAG: hypothetical protein RLZZ267_1395 [Bacillota bacterium]|jgi:hypothetical protein
MDLDISVAVIITLLLFNLYVYIEGYIKGKKRGVKEGTYTLLKHYLTSYEMNQFDKLENNLRYYKKMLNSNLDSENGFPQPKWADETIRDWQAGLINTAKELENLKKCNLEEFEDQLNYRKLYSTFLKSGVDEAKFGKLINEEQIKEFYDFINVTHFSD